MLIKLKHSVLFAYLLFKGFAHATIYKFMTDMSVVTLPDVPVSNRLRRNIIDTPLVKRTMTRVGLLTNTLIHFTTRKCFYRAYTAAYILRKNGIAVTLNIGLHHLTKKDRGVRGHCWLSWQGQPLAENDDPGVRYSRFLGTGKNGVCYWLGGDNTAKHKIVHYRTAKKG